MEIEISKIEDVTVVRASGRIDAATAPEFERQCQVALAGGGANLVLDFAGVRYISSAGLRGVLTAGKTVLARGGVLHMAALTGVVQEVFAISGFSTMFPQFPSAEDAVAHCRPKA
jgi:anti-sigma B factor antagonist